MNINDLPTPSTPIPSRSISAYSKKPDTLGKVDDLQKKIDPLKAAIPKIIIPAKAAMAQISVDPISISGNSPIPDLGKKDLGKSDPDQHKKSSGSPEKDALIERIAILKLGSSKKESEKVSHLENLTQKKQGLQIAKNERINEISAAALTEKGIGDNHHKMKLANKTAAEKRNESQLFYNNGILEENKGLVEHDKGVAEHEKGVAEHEKGVVEEHLSEENIADMGTLTAQISAKVQHGSEHQPFKNMTLYLHLKHLLNEHSSLKNKTPHRESPPETILRHQQSVHDLTTELATIYTKHSEILKNRGIPEHEHHLHVPEDLMLEMAEMEDGQIKLKGPENILKNYSLGMRLPDGRTIGKIKIMTSEEHQAKLEEVTALLTNLHMIMALHDDTVEQEEVVDKSIFQTNVLKPKDVAKSQHPEQEQAVKLLQIIAPKVLIEAFFESVRKFDKRMLDQFLEQIDEAHEIRKDSIKYFDRQSEILGAEILVKKRNPFDLRKPELISMLNRFVRDYYNCQNGLK